MSEWEVVTPQRELMSAVAEGQADLIDLDAAVNWLRHQRLVTGAVLLTDAILLGALLVGLVFFARGSMTFMTPMIGSLGVMLLVSGVWLTLRLSGITAELMRAREVCGWQKDALRQAENVLDELELT